MLQYPEKVCRISEAETSELEELPLAMAAGRICGEYIYLYPPGIPVIVPGEVFDAQTLDAIQKCQKLGLDVEGLPQADRVNVVISKRN